MSINDYWLFIDGVGTGAVEGSRIRSVRVTAVAVIPSSSSFNSKLESVHTAARELDFIEETLKKKGRDIR